MTLGFRLFGGELRTLQGRQGHSLSIRIPKSNFVYQLRYRNNITGVTQDKPTPLNGGILADVRETETLTFTIQH